MNEYSFTATDEEKGLADRTAARLGVLLPWSYDHDEKVWTWTTPSRQMYDNFVLQYEWLASVEKVVYGGGLG